MTGAENRRHKLDPLVLEMLVCPLTKTRLTLSADRTELVSIAARLAFPITSGVPLLSLEEARPIDPDELARITHRLH
ncbi:Trm112 family protein [Devosia sp. YIM 151766]|uniref:Trm112 family protein n=1 Tax=Devosia sp. YIM 151766 TaxID=3017325 RepID=UPI00255C7D97|nr:Trm112 family protein [Devosia sp. YIM 151766]WIY52940.1 Trm112 family protein [Devosia sp. YIM 151766]